MKTDCQSRIEYPHYIPYPTLLYPTYNDHHTGGAWGEQAEHNKGIYQVPRVQKKKEKTSIDNKDRKLAKEILFLSGTGYLMVVMVRGEGHICPALISRNNNSISMTIYFRLYKNCSRYISVIRFKSDRQ